ncbi:glycosyltransferase [Lacticaseibacillus baoqingensis]|uniref:Glycosyltransferase n=2 Tax=Lacticaseibacillus baoqingensis TaxID=2486013 RepID=A0ABW4E3J1_9LACO
MLRIVVNDGVAVPGAGGVYSVLKDFEKMIGAYSSDPIEWIFILSGPFVQERDHVKVIQLPKLKSSKLYRLGFDFLWGRRFINQLDPDIYISFQNTATLGVHAKQFVYLHQPLNYVMDIHKFSFLNQRERKLAIYQRIFGPIINLLIRFANANVIVQTEWLKKILVKRNIQSSQKITVISPTVFVTNKKIRQRPDNFFYPATPMIYKNHRTLIDVCRILSEKGINSFRIFLTITEQDLRELSGAENIPFQIKCLGSIERSKVYKLMEESVLLFPSSIETFGLPLLEAKNMGTEIFSANIGPAREILENYDNVEFFEVGNSAQLAELMKSWLNKDIPIKFQQTDENIHEQPQNVADFLVKEGNNR